MSKQKKSTGQKVNIYIIKKTIRINKQLDLKKQLELKQTIRIKTNNQNKQRIRINKLHIRINKELE